MPPNISVQGAGYAPPTPSVSAINAPTSAVETARQTQIAVTGLGAALIPNTANYRPTIVVQPRPAYIAAQFLAQDLSAQEVEAFFTPASPTIVQSNVQPQQLQAAPSPSSQSASPNQAELVTQTTLASEQPAPAAIDRPRRDAGLSAYSSANALLASAPEVDTSL
ncbi:MAG: hypothetical protein J0M34_06410 [Alphaproteobacteria bacterium]|nr:hypothetical protein [Alphaproteobacteria bacterium]